MALIVTHGCPRTVLGSAACPLPTPTPPHHVPCSAPTQAEGPGGNPLRPRGTHRNVGKAPALDRGRFVRTMRADDEAQHLATCRRRPDCCLPTYPPLPPPPCEPARRPRRAPHGANISALPGSARDPPQVGLRNRSAPPASGAHGRRKLTDHPGEGWPLCDVRTRGGERTAASTAPRCAPYPLAGYPQ